MMERIGEINSVVNGFMAIPNLIALFLLSKKLVSIIKAQNN